MVNPVEPTNPFVVFRREETKQSIPDRFEQQVRLHSSRLAVRDNHNALTYQTLNRLVNRIAWTILAQRGHGLETIGVLLEPKPITIAAILGVLKAGKIWVPIDPALPQARIVCIMRDAQIRLLLTDTAQALLAANLSEGKPILNIDRLDAGASEANPTLSIAPDALAYILYTSGSTGRPKGVTQSHRNVLHFIRWHTNSLHICANDRLSLLASYSHLAGGTATFRALFNGATVLPYHTKKRGIGDLADWLRREEITLCQTTPTVFRQLAQSLRSDDTFPKLRLLHLGGESVSRKDVELYKRHCASDCLLLVNLGSTEVSTYRQYLINKETEIRSNIVPVGYAVEDKEVLLLDEAGQPVPSGEVGEIAVKSRYLTPGYWGRDDLTQAVFIPVPEMEGVRIFRTGDLGRMLPDGCLVHVGRTDAQVKVRGFRMELGEIEAVLAQYPAVREAVVLVREEAPQDSATPAGTHKRLVAYVVPDNTLSPSTSELRSFLKERLPEYMIPSAFVLVDALPLTPSGKVDRRALPAPDQTRPDLKGAFVAARTPVEEVLVKIWSKVLGLKEVGVHDNFFELGGDSLLATQVISRVINTFKVELPIQFLFESLTVADMVVVITENMAKKAGDEELACMLAELESISDEEARKRLADEEIKEASEK